MMSETSPPAECLPAITPWYWVVSSLVTWGLVAGAATAGVLWFTWRFTWPLPWWAPAAVVTALLVISLILVPLRYARYRYRVDAREFTLLRGRLIQRRITAAVPQILHTEVTQGPIQRLFGLVMVKARQAVGSVDLGPVRPDEAERLRVLVLEVTQKPSQT